MGAMGALYAVETARMPAIVSRASALIVSRLKRTWCSQTLVVFPVLASVPSRVISTTTATHIVVGHRCVDDALYSRPL